MGATLAVIGLGRIGAFHAETLSGLAGVDELVVTDERPEVTAAVADKLGARAVPDARAALAAGVDGVVIAAATPAHARLILAAVRGRDPGVLREADRVHRRGEPRRGGPAGQFHGAGADRLQQAL